MGVCGSAAPNCTLWSLGIDDTKYHADPDIAGIGVIVAFVVTSFVTITISHTSLLLGIVRGYEDNVIDVWFLNHLQKVPVLRQNEYRTKFWQPIMEHLVLALSDQQLVVGISILVAGFVKHCSISVYHFSIVADLSWFTSNTHMTSLNVLRVYLNKNQTLRNWRVCLMLVIFVLLMASTVLQGHWYWVESWNSPAQCLFDDLSGNIGGESSHWMAANIVLLVYGYSTSVYRLYSTDKLEKVLLDTPVEKMRNAQSTIEKRGRALAVSGRLRSYIASTILMSSGAVIAGTGYMYIAVAAFLGSLTMGLCFDIGWFVYSLYGIIVERKIPPSLMDGNENEWGFGQVVPLVLLGSIILTFKELHTEQSMKVRTQDFNDNRDNADSGIELSHTASRREKTTTLQSHDLEDSEPAVSPNRVDTESGNRGDRGKEEQKRM